MLFLTVVLFYMVEIKHRMGFSMKRQLLILIALMLTFLLWACDTDESVEILTTTKPVYEFTSLLCGGTDLQVKLLITDNVSCLHDYSLQVKQMRLVERANLIIINGAGFEDFLEDVIPKHKTVIDSSQNISLICAGEEHHDHSHQSDPHIWLSIANASTMAKNIAYGLCDAYPAHKAQIMENLQSLNERFRELEQEADCLSLASCKKLVTFHDGFSYMADSYGLEILHSLEEESGSEASAAELIEIISVVRENHLPAIFTEVSGAASAAAVIQAETGVKVYALDMGMSQRGYFEAMQYNIHTLKEALE